MVEKELLSKYITLQEVAVPLTFLGDQSSQPPLYLIVKLAMAILLLLLHLGEESLSKRLKTIVLLQLQLMPIHMLLLMELISHLLHEFRTVMDQLHSQWDLRLLLHSLIRARNMFLLQAMVVSALHHRLQLQWLQLIHLRFLMKGLAHILSQLTCRYPLIKSYLDIEFNQE